MPRKTQGIFPISRLTRRIVFWVFISVIFIEALIFIPWHRVIFFWDTPTV